jgi:hypothetical protein
MSWDFDGTLAYSPDVEWDIGPRLEEVRLGIYKAGLVTVWEVQSQLATLALLAMAALTPIWLAMATMIAWALIATCAYRYARRKGFPDMLEASWRRPPAEPKRWGRWLGSVCVSGVRAWLAGIQPYLYCLAVGRVLAAPAQSWRRGLVRKSILVVGCTLFGVTAVHHLLRRAGIAERQAFRYSLLGPFLNVPYRVMLTFIAVDVILGRVNAPFIW